jgi:hypothetical protein
MAVVKTGGLNRGATVQLRLDTCLLFVRQNEFNKSLVPPFAKFCQRGDERGISLADSASHKQREFQIYLARDLEAAVFCRFKGCGEVRPYDDQLYTLSTAKCLDGRMAETFFVARCERSTAHRQG